jgi:hypothetical protein
MLRIDTKKLAEAMDWVVPPDASPGAGSEAGVRHMLDLLESLPSPVTGLYEQHLEDLREVDLQDLGHPLGPVLVEHVRDVYYSFADTGAWTDMGFKVTDP